MAVATVGSSDAAYGTLAVSGSGNTPPRSQQSLAVATTPKSTNDSGQGQLTMSQRLLTETIVEHALSKLRTEVHNTETRTLASTKAERKEREKLFAGLRNEFRDQQQVVRTEIAELAAETRALKKQQDEFLQSAQDAQADATEKSESLNERMDQCLARVEQYLSKSELENFVKQQELENYVTRPEFEEYRQQTDRSVAKLQEEVAAARKDAEVAASSHASNLERVKRELCHGYLARELSILKEFVEETKQSITRTTTEEYTTLKAQFDELAKSVQESQAIQTRQDEQVVKVNGTLEEHTDALLSIKELSARVNTMEKMRPELDLALNDHMSEVSQLNEKMSADVEKAKLKTAECIDEFRAVRATCDTVKQEMAEWNAISEKSADCVERVTAEQERLKKLLDEEHESSLKECREIRRDVTGQTAKLEDLEGRWKVHDKGFDSVGADLAKHERIFRDLSAEIRSNFQASKKLIEEEHETSDTDRREIRRDVIAHAAKLEEFEAQWKKYEGRLVDDESNMAKVEQNLQDLAAELHRDFLGHTAKVEEHEERLQRHEGRLSDIGCNSARQELGLTNLTAAVESKSVKQEQDLKDLAKQEQDLKDLAAEIQRTLEKHGAKLDQYESECTALMVYEPESGKALEYGKTNTLFERMKLMFLRDRKPQEEKTEVNVDTDDIMQQFRTLMKRFETLNDMFTQDRNNVHHKVNMLEGVINKFNYDKHVQELAALRADTDKDRNIFQKALAEFKGTTTTRLDFIQGEIDKLYKSTGEIDKVCKNEQGSIVELQKAGDQDRRNFQKMVDKLEGEIDKLCKSTGEIDKVCKSEQGSIVELQKAGDQDRRNFQKMVDKLEGEVDKLCKNEHGKNIAELQQDRGIINKKLDAFEGEVDKIRKAEHGKHIAELQSTLEQDRNDLKKKFSMLEGEIRTEVRTEREASVAFQHRLGTVQTQQEALVKVSDELKGEVDTLRKAKQLQGQKLDEARRSLADIQKIGEQDRNTWKKKFDMLQGEIKTEVRVEREASVALQKRVGIIQNEQLALEKSIKNHADSLLSHVSVTNKHASNLTDLRDQVGLLQRASYDQYDRHSLLAQSTPLRAEVTELIRTHTAGAATATALQELADNVTKQETKLATQAQQQQQQSQAILLLKKEGANILSEVTKMEETFSQVSAKLENDDKELSQTKKDINKLHSELAVTNHAINTLRK